MSDQDRKDLLERRASMAKTVLMMLMISLESDCQPTSDTITEAISAAVELLEV